MGEFFLKVNRCVGIDTPTFLFLFVLSYYSIFIFNIPIVLFLKLLY